MWQRKSRGFQVDSVSSVTATAAPTPSTSCSSGSSFSAPGVSSPGGGISNQFLPNSFYATTARYPSPLQKFRGSYSSERDINSAATIQYTLQQHGTGRKRHIIDEDESLEAGDDDDQLEYQPAPGSPSGKEQGEEAEEDDGDDPLDAYMAGIEVQARKDKETAAVHEKEGLSNPTKDNKAKLGRTDIEDEDMQESYFMWLEENKPNMLYIDDDEDDIEYDEEGNPIFKKKIIDPLPDIDHSSISYEDFSKHFYVEHKDISALSPDDVNRLLDKLGLKVTGLNPPKPVTSFAHFNFDSDLMHSIRKSEYSQPTPIQSQGIPVALSGRDIIGIAKTGSGKTAAYLWPALVHIMDQRELLPGDGPIVLICVPTRELAIQVYNEAKKFGKVYNINVICAYGGGSKWEQSKALQEGAEIVVATPGRLIDLVTIEATNLTRVTFLVFDEADRMFDLGFEAQVRSIANHVRPDRQCLMFSATFKKKVERLARDILTDPIRILQGDLGEANADIEQSVIVFDAGPQKFDWLLKNLVQFCTKGNVLIFVTKKQNSEELAQSLRGKDFSLGLLHGDMFQTERNEVIHAFRKQSVPILVATDVAARGLDIPSIKTVVNYDVARDIDTHVHRIGRTGRAGEKGWAYTLVTDKDKEFAGHLVRNLESVNQKVPKSLLDLAMQSAWFKKSRLKKNVPAKKPGVGGRGLGYKEPTMQRSKKNDFVGSGGGNLGKSSTTRGPLQGPLGSTGGGSRLSQLKARFSMSYQSKFCAASSGADFDAGKIAATDPTPESKGQSRKKTRWQ